MEFPYSREDLQGLKEFDGDCFWSILAIDLGYIGWQNGNIREEVLLVQRLGLSKQDWNMYLKLLPDEEGLLSKEDQEKYQV